MILLDILDIPKPTIDLLSKEFNDACQLDRFCSGEHKAVDLEMQNCED
jgi:hypothetical protein